MLQCRFSDPRRGMAFGVLFSCLIALLTVPAYAAVPDPEARYQALLADAQAGHPPVDWQVLRFAYADRPGFILQSREYGDLRQQMFTAFGAQDWAKALATSQQMIEKDFVDPEAHMIASICFKKLGEDDKAQRDRDVAAGLFRSIETADGLTKATSLTVISVDEEYIYLRMKGLRPTQQSLVREDGHGYDVIETKDAKGQVRSVYFQIDRVLAAEMKLLQH